MQQFYIPNYNTKLVMEADFRLPLSWRYHENEIKRLDKLPALRGLAARIEKEDRLRVKAGIEYGDTLRQITISDDLRRDVFFGRLERVLDGAEITEETRARVFASEEAFKWELGSAHITIPAGTSFTIKRFEVLMRYNRNEVACDVEFGEDLNADIRNALHGPKRGMITLRRRQLEGMRFEVEREGFNLWDF